MNREEEIKAANPYGNSSSFASGKMIGFTIGAEWADAHPKNPWISVKEQLPEEGQKVFVLVMCYGTPYIREEKFCRNSNLDKKGMWIHGNSIVLAWFPIPSFEEILEANKDVLERIKEKGDRIQTCSPMK